MQIAIIPKAAERKTEAARRERRRARSLLSTLKHHVAVERSLTPQTATKGALRKLLYAMQPSCRSSPRSNFEKFDVCLCASPPRRATARRKKTMQLPDSDCGDVIALTEGDSGCHGCQAARPGADQTAGYGRRL